MLSPQCVLIYKNKYNLWMELLICYYDWVCQRALPMFNPVGLVPNCIYFNAIGWFQGHLILAEWTGSQEKVLTYHFWKIPLLLLLYWSFQMAGNYIFNYLFSLWRNSITASEKQCPNGVTQKGSSGSLKVQKERKERKAVPEANKHWRACLQSQVTASLAIAMTL